MHRLKVPVRVIADIDVLRDLIPLKSIVEELGLAWSSVSKQWLTIKNYIDAQDPAISARALASEIEKVLSSVTDEYLPRVAKARINGILRKASPWSSVKDAGVDCLTDKDVRQTFDDLAKQLKSRGLFVLEVGEIEAFDSTIEGHGPRWVARALAAEIQKPEYLKKAKDFIFEIMS